MPNVAAEVIGELDSAHEIEWAFFALEIVASVHG
jgi:hypothetical protein